MPDGTVPRHVLLRYFLLTYLAVLVNSSSYLRAVHFAGPLTVVFAIAAYLVYSLLYVGPLFLFLWLMQSLLRTNPSQRLLARIKLSPASATYVLAILCTWLLQVLIFSDAFIFRIYGFHLNGFVWNLVTTRGGIESLGNSPSTTLSFVLIIIGLFIAQIVLLFLAIAMARRSRRPAGPPRRGRIITAAVAIFCLAAFTELTFGVSNVYNYTPVLAASNAFPLFVPVSFNHLAERLGVEVHRDPSFTVKVDAGAVRYPLSPIKTEPLTHPPYNIILLVAESLRYDMLDPEIMPATWDAAHKSLWCTNHYSGGNGTRMAMFSMFYGLYGASWFPFLTEKRGPVLVDVLLNQKYQVEMYTSAGFAYPEFDKTIFAHVSPDHLHERIALPAWRSDQQQVAAMLEFIDHRDKSRPFFSFMFFESPHANYHFPPECAIRKPFMEDVNYATMDLTKDIGLMKNRYINACNHFDTQVDRIFKYLTTQGLLDSTIVLVTGDHGEEFMEKGRWGHNSSFHEEQARPPFVLWVPGKPPRHREDLTSHLDLPATLMPLLGVTNPPADYSFGMDLLANTSRTYTVVCSWTSVAYIDDQYKAVIPLKTTGFGQQEVTTRNDTPLEDTSAFFSSRGQQLVKVIAEFKKFSR